MPSPNAGARVAPITNEVATTTGRDAKKSSPDEGRGTHSADKPNAQQRNQAHDSIRDPFVVDRCGAVVRPQCDRPIDFPRVIGNVSVA